MKGVIFFYLLFTSLAFSQQEASVWYFGQNAGIKFNANGTITTLTDGQLNTLEGCASIADTSGSLLFYTDGVTVWNKNHQIMLNGTGLFGDFSTTQSATIVPKPGSANLYYIFTLDALAGTNGFRYSEVDISLGGGLGAVTSNKNVLIYTPTNEKLAIVKHANNTDYWVVTHGWNNNSFHSYLLNSSGLSALPVTSNAGFVVSGSTDNTWGYMKIAPDGSKLAVSHSLNHVELLDFNIATGTVSNPVILYSGVTYGVEFSENSNALYISVTDPSPYKIIQYDLSATNIPATSQLVYNSTITPAALQLGPDKKIYIAQFNKTKLGVINNPNVVGLGCNVQMDVVDLSGRVCNLGLPPFISSFFNASFTAQNLCFGDTTQFNFSTNQTITGVLWNFGDTFTSSATNPSHQYANPGTYNVSMTVTTTTGNITKNRQITISDVPVIANTIANQSLCGNANQNYNLTQFNTTILGSQSTTTFGVAYFSSSANASTHNNPLPANYNLPLGSTTFLAKVYNLSNVNCYAVTSFTVNLFQQPFANPASNTFVCDDPSNDGVAIFNLQANSNQILGTQNSSDYTISYYISQADADSGNTPLSANYQNTANPQTIYARIQNNLNPNCFATTTFQIGLRQMPVANQPPDLFACDLGNDNTESFNLNTQNAVVLGSQSAGNFTVSYHATQADANSGNNPLSSSTSVINSKIIYVRIENSSNTGCFATTFFTAYVKALPAINLIGTYAICQGQPITLTAPNGFSSYNWSTGATTPAITISQPGNYTLTVTKNYGGITCSNSQTISVTASDNAAIASIAIQDWTDVENSIAVLVVGGSDYEYSLDGIHYQSSNVFNGLASGPYTVHVKNGCGTASENVFLLSYPKFFTPNNDGINDYWKIKYADTEPKMTIAIYDRYGKLLKQMQGQNMGWDGTFNGVPLFADDYWFVVRRQNGQEHKGHFTLKR